MMRRWMIVFLLVFGQWSSVLAGTLDLDAIVKKHVLNGYSKLALEAQNLKATATEFCEVNHPALLEAYHLAFDAWIGVSHLRFGPSEDSDRAFALAFWPDPRGSTPKALAALFRDKDPVVYDPEEFATVSVAARGFYALEFLLFDERFTFTESEQYWCALVQAVTSDIARNSVEIHDAWESEYGAFISSPVNDTYRTEGEAVRQFFTALATGLEFTSEARLGRPMGTFERPRPNRAETRRSERSLRNVILSLGATRELAGLMAPNNENLDKSFSAALQRAKALDDPMFAEVTSPQGRFRVETLQQAVDEIRDILAQEVGPSLGIAAGFNSLDGD